MYWQSTDNAESQGRQAVRAKESKIAAETRRAISWVVLI
jgi:hypothetical protein